MYRLAESRSEDHLTKHGMRSDILVLSLWVIMIQRKNMKSQERAFWNLQSVRLTSLRITTKYVKGKASSLGNEYGAKQK